MTGRSLNLTSLNLSGDGEECGGREASKLTGWGLGWSDVELEQKKKKKSLRFQVESVTSTALHN